jgi:hypothetical protein
MAAFLAGLPGGGKLKPYAASTILKKEVMAFEEGSSPAVARPIGGAETIFLALRKQTL